MLYEIEAFSIETDRVVQGEYSAIAESPVRMVSNYQVHAPTGISRYVDFKFGLNGADNELPFAVNHRMVIRPQGGIYIHPPLVFGERDSVEPSRPVYGDFLEPGSRVKLQVDLRPVFEAWKTQGFYQGSDGQKWTQKDFKGVWVAGSREPLTWDWNSLSGRDDLQLQDEDGDQIYEIELIFNPTSEEKTVADQQGIWELATDITQYPGYEAPNLIEEALYHMALEETELDIREDGAFMAGKNWPGVWTRDISYAIHLAMAIVNPEASQKSLEAKVAGDRIIQDTGTGGAWPVSTDRMVWAIAAWELYQITGDSAWAAYIHRVIKNSIAQDLEVALGANGKGFYGESSFLDWREQSYPEWFRPVDIYQSYALGTNAVMFEAYRIHARLCERFGETPLFDARLISDFVNDRLWIPEKGYYAQFQYGDQTPLPSERAEALGASLCMLFDIADEEKKQSLMSHMPILTWGTPTISPQIPDIPPYHNNSIWPFVHSYWTWAAAKARHPGQVTHGLAANYRQAALFLTNKENMVAETGDFGGTEINSDRQLWSVAGQLAMVFRVLFGMSFEDDTLRFNPIVPENWGGIRRISGLKYRDAVLDITLEGYGDRITAFYVDGGKRSKPFLAGSLSGEHEIRIKLNNRLPNPNALRFAPHIFSLPAPKPVLQGAMISWVPVPNAEAYQVVFNGEVVGQIVEPQYEVDDQDSFGRYQFRAVAADRPASFLSEAVNWVPPSAEIILKPKGKLDRTYSGYSGKGYQASEAVTNEAITFNTRLKKAGTYLLEIRYANGNGPVNTENKCAIRDLHILEPEGKEQTKVVVMPQLGDQEWSRWGYSNRLQLALKAGEHQFQLRYHPQRNRNMNAAGVNRAMIDHLRLIRISP